MELDQSQREDNFPIMLPLTNEEQFDETEAALREEAVRRKMITHLALVGGTNSENMIRRMLSAAMTNSLACIFNWVGKGEKRAFKDTLIKDCMFAAARQFDCKLTELTYRDGVQKWLLYAPERNGEHILKRQILERLLSKFELALIRAPLDLDFLEFACRQELSVSDEELDNVVISIKNDMPTAGYRMVKGRLLSIGLRVLGLCIFTVTTSPAVEKTRSADTLVPGIHKYRFDTRERRGNVISWTRHQFKGSSVRGRDDALITKLGGKVDSVSSAGSTVFLVGGVSFSQ
ncbi:hypothetical protein NQZ68_029795 [Dissostichus eleginoides]|nr:hypothetical protein NQZ68_029795 [Dissostichus eleginoides]